MEYIFAVTKLYIDSDLVADFVYLTLFGTLAARVSIY
jgi:hypothetical protein